jgi:hypothetical protein
VPGCCTKAYAARVGYPWPAVDVGDANETVDGDLNDEGSAEM